MAEAVLQTTVRAEAREETVRDLSVIAGWFIGLSLLYWIAVLLVVGGPGFPLDDAYIHLQFAKNLYFHGEMAFNPGVPSSGSTAPLWPALIAGAYALLGNWYAAVYVLAGVCSLGTALIVYGIVRSWTGRRDLARFAGLLTVLTNPTVVQAYNGMEAAAYSLIFLLALWCYGTPGRRLWATALLAVGVWLRPEFLVFLPITVLERWISLYRGGARRPAAYVREALPHVGVWACVVLLYVSYHWHQDGHLVPTTFGAKYIARGIARPLWMESVPATLRRGHVPHLLLALTVWPLMVLVLAGITLGVNCAPLGFGLKNAIWALWKDKSQTASGWRLAIMSLIGYPYLRGFVDSLGGAWFQQQRYYAHLTPLLVLVVIGATPVTRAIVTRRWWSWKDVSLSVQMRRTFAWAAAATVGWGVMSVVSVSNISFMQVPLGRWVHDNTQPDDLIATNDIGAIAFLGERRVLDTVGLVEPAVVEHVMAGGDLLGYMKQRRPAYVIIFPDWYEDLSQRLDVLKPVKEVDLDFNVVCGASRMVVYRPDWR